MHQNGSTHYVNTGYLRCFRIGTDCEHILTEGCLVPDEPHNDNNDSCQPYIVGNGDSCSAGIKGYYASFYHIIEMLIQTGQRLAVIAVDHDIH